MALVFDSRRSRADRAQQKEFHPSCLPLASLWLVRKGPVNNFGSPLFCVGNEIQGRPSKAGIFLEFESFEAFYSKPLCVSLAGPMIETELCQI
jgi:hypothetical protein